MIRWERLTFGCFTAPADRQSDVCRSKKRLRDKERSKASKHKRRKKEEKESKKHSKRGKEARKESKRKDPAREDAAAAKKENGEKARRLTLYHLLGSLHCSADLQLGAHFVRCVRLYPSGSTLLRQNRVPGRTQPAAVAQSWTASESSAIH